MLGVELPAMDSIGGNDGGGIDGDRLSHVVTGGGLRSVGTGRNLRFPSREPRIFTTGIDAGQEPVRHTNEITVLGVPSVTVYNGDQTSSGIDDLEDFAPTMELKRLPPTVPGYDYTDDIPSDPLL
ncbi:hypothetical protein NE237_026162 [Protea cynaroides]|uniref:Uncharacterized protein n=1 Tax=Protea cynaroides TaxID=273540 RepID=A0A9Q0H5L8_9MAGN|nr:hypothetical protein NE237_026162 [Protea cynaroides]